MVQTEVARLLGRCIESNEEGWLELVRCFGAGLKSNVRRALVRCGVALQDEVVEDLVQEVYCRLLERDRHVLRRCRAQTSASLAAYLRAICDSVVADRLRLRRAAKRGSGQREHGLDGHGAEPFLYDPAPSAEAGMLGTELRERCRGLLHEATRGPDAARNGRILELVFVHGWSSREIAEGFATELKASSIDSLVFRAKRRLGTLGVELPQR